MENNQYSYYFLHNNDCTPYINVRGNSFYPQFNEDEAVYCYLPINTGKYVDIPDALILNDNINLLRLETSMLVTSYKITRGAYKKVDKTYKGGLERSLYYHSVFLNNFSTLELIRITPESKKDGTTLFGDTFYTGQGIILDKNKDLLFGVFVRTVKLGKDNYQAKECVIKVSEKVFLDQAHPLYKIILKDILPNVLNRDYHLYFSDLKNRRMFNFPDGVSTARLPVIMEVNPIEKVLEHPEVLKPGFSNEDICNEALLHIDHIL